MTATDHETPRLSLTVHADDNVATILDTCVEGGCIAGGIEIARGIPFGHKVALCGIAVGEAVVKYGAVIGRARSAIASGEHVHVHNVE